MAKKAEMWNAVMKGLGCRPTRYLLRWTPTFKHPFQFDLQEVFRCRVDGEVLTPTTPESFRQLHGGHHFDDPHRYSLWELLKVQLRIIR